MQRINTAAMLGFVFVVGVAHAEIVHFVNPAPGQSGHYDWHWENSNGWQSWLNITLSPQQQTNTPSPSSISQMFDPFGNVHGEAPGSLGQFAHILAIYGIVPNTLALDFGLPITESFEFGFHEGALSVGLGGVSQFPEHERVYIGVRTISGQLGWIEVARTGMSLTAFAWGYETVPGAAITAGQIPSPGGATLVVLGAGSVLVRRRRA